MTLAEIENKIKKLEQRIKDDPELAEDYAPVLARLKNEREAEVKIVAAKEKDEVEKALFQKEIEMEVTRVDQILKEYEKDGDTNFLLTELFNALVPPKGKATTVLGEIVRAINHLIYRWENDGDIFNIGYGLETAGPDAAYLMKFDEFKGGFNEWINWVDPNSQWESDIDDEYRSWVEGLEAIFGELPASTLKKWLATPNTIDSRRLTEVREKVMGWEKEHEENVWDDLRDSVHDKMSYEDLYDQLNAGDVVNEGEWDKIEKKLKELVNKISDDYEVEGPSYIVEKESGDVVTARDVDYDVEEEIIDYIFDEILMSLDDLDSLLEAAGVTLWKQYD